MFTLTRDDIKRNGKALFWNRREKRWQSYCTKSCVYPTNRGAAKMSKRLAVEYSGEWIHIAHVNAR